MLLILLTKKKETNKSKNTNAGWDGKQQDKSRKKRMDTFIRKLRIEASRYISVFSQEVYVKEGDKRDSKPKKGDLSILRSHAIRIITLGDMT